MLFNSIQFLVFFPLVTLAYFLIPKKVRWVWLLVASYFFYMCWNPKYLVLIVISTVITWVSGLLIGRVSARGGDAARTVRLKKLCVAASFVLNLGILFFFKYFSFAMDSVGALLAQAGVHFAAPSFDVVLPVGISFYTFQALSYTVDVYRGEIAPEKCFGRYALFVSFFPQLVAGPIERSGNLLKQINEPQTFDHDRMRSGLLLMAWGLVQKMVIADRAAIFVNQVYNNQSQYSGMALAAATLLFALQIYCDFAGYSNIAIGAAQVMGFKLMDNFRRPYFAFSIREFWRRWHISLSTWFKDYLYIPLGGSRRGRARKYLNTMITFILSGLWHGANWTFAVWGALHGAYQVAGDVTSPLREKLRRRLAVNEDCFSFKLAQGIFTFVLVCFAWIFFRAASVGDAWQIIVKIFTSFRPILTGEALYAVGLSYAEIGVLAIGAASLVGVDFLREKGVDIRAFIAAQQAWFRWTVYAALAGVIIVLGIYGTGYAQSQFIYFQF